MNSFEIIFQELQEQVNTLESFRKKLLIKYWFIRVISYLIVFYIAYISIDNIVGMVEIINTIEDLIVIVKKMGLVSIIERMISLFKSGNLALILGNIIIPFWIYISLFFVFIFAIRLVLYYTCKALDIIIVYFSKWVLKYDLEYQKFYKDYKEKIMTKLISFFGEELNYFPDKKIKKDFFLESNLYDGPFVRYKGDDYVEGYIDKTKIIFSELNVWKKVDKNGETKVFQGLFFIADFNKQFSHKTIVREKNVFKMSKLLNFILDRIIYKYRVYLYIIIFMVTKYNFDLIHSIVIIIALVTLWTILKMLIGTRLGKAELENKDFEDLYDVYGDDQQEIRYLLTPSLMEKLVDLQLKTKYNINISFVKSKIFIAIPFAEALFEANLFESINKTLKIHYQLLELVIGIVEELDLNTRIWTKK